MIEYFTQDLLTSLILFQAVMLLVVLSNIFLLRRTQKLPPLNHYPLVSVLIPARNEERNIARSVRSLLAQDYPAYEIIVLDDRSEDGTLTILNEIASGAPRLQVLAGRVLPDGWIGKNWACTQLAEQAQGEVLLFSDADTYFQPQTLKKLVNALDGEKADVLTGFPSQEMYTWGERMLVPFFSWAFFCFTPLMVAYWLKLPFLSSGVGQMLLFRRPAYLTVGGHAAIHGQIAEDLSLVRRVKAAGLRWRVAHITGLISSRMYTGWGEAFRGFSKNYFAAFDFRVLPYLFIFGWLAVMFWVPLVVLVLYGLGLAPLARPEEVIACIVLSLLVWIIPYGQLGFNIWLAFLYPLTLFFTEVVALNSLRLALTGHLEWKNRRLERPHWKFL